MQLLTMPPLLGEDVPNGARAAITTTAMPWLLLQQPVIDPPLLLGLLPPAGRQQLGNTDAHPWHPQHFEVRRAAVIVLVAKYGQE